MFFEKSDVSNDGVIGQGRRRVAGFKVAIGVRLPNVSYYVNSFQARLSGGMIQNRADVNEKKKAANCFEMMSESRQASKVGANKLDSND